MASRASEDGLAPPLAPHDPEEFVQSLLEQLRKALSDYEKYSDARFEYHTALQSLQVRAVSLQEPDVANRALCLLGEVLAKKGYLSDAADCFKSALTLMPDRAMELSYVECAAETPRSVLLRCGNLLYASGRYGDVVDVLHNGLASCPDDTEDEPADKASVERRAKQALIEARVNVNMGVALEALGELEHAIEAYQTAARLNPSYALAHKLLGGALLGMQSWKEAEAALLKAVSLQGSFADAWADLGMARRWLSDLEGATMALQLATFHQPDHALAHWNLAYALRDSGKYAEAIQAFAKVLELQPTHWAAHVHTAVCALLLNKPPGGKPRALADLQAASLKMSDGADVGTALDTLLDMCTSQEERSQSFVANLEQMSMAYASGFDMFALAQPPGAEAAARIHTPLQVKQAVQQCRDLWAGRKAHAARGLRGLVGGWLLAGKHREAADCAAQWQRLAGGAQPKYPNGYCVTRTHTSATGGLQVVLSVPGEQRKAPEVTHNALPVEPVSEGTPFALQSLPPEELNMTGSPARAAAPAKSHRFVCYVPAMFSGCRQLAAGPLRGCTAARSKPAAAPAPDTVDL